MKVLSLTHLVAVSGANLAIVTAAVFLLLSNLGAGRHIRFGLSYLAMGCYVLLVGPESSVLRAATMASFVLAGLWVGRKVNPLQMLAWAVILLLVVDPGLAVDFGFALSVFATTGLLVLATEIYQRLKGRMNQWLALGIAASFSAQLYTMPILMMLQPSIPLYSVVANLVIEPVVAPVTILGILGVVAALFAPPLATVITWVASLGTWWITFVAKHLSQLPFAQLPVIPGPVGIALMVALIVGVTLWITTKQVWQRIIAYLLVATGLLVPALSVGAGTLRSVSFQGDWQVVNCDVGQGDALVLRSEDRVALIDVGREPKLIDKCLSRLNVEHLDLLVLSHFDADHVAGISGAINGRSVGTALISGYSDDRPLVMHVSRSLQAVGVRPQVGFRGLSGELGEACWKILSPTADASESKDSNDASLVLSFDFGSFAILALGDLGESGQQRLIRNSFGDLAELSSKTLITKVAHHGSADQSRELYELLQTDVALLSVGIGNDYGHPTERVFRILNSSGASIYRTDQQGAIAMRIESGELRISTAGKLSL
jgi:competence protein ComEC